MKGSLQLSNNMKSRLFWDVDVANMDAESNSRLIIERIFCLGTVKEIREALGYYGKEKVLDTLLNLNYLDPKTLNFVSTLFNKPKNEFKCYTKKQLTPQHWLSNERRLTAFTRYSFLFSHYSILTSHYYVV